VWANQAASPWKRNVLENDFRGLFIPAVTDEGQEGRDVDVGRAGVLARRSRVLEAGAGSALLFPEVTEELPFLFFEQSKNRRSDLLHCLARQALGNALQRSRMICCAFAFTDFREQPDNARRSAALGSLVISDEGIERLDGPGNDACACRLFSITHDTSILTRRFA
jgi:hypothetical protein